MTKYLKMSFFFLGVCACVCVRVHVRVRACVCARACVCKEKNKGNMTRVSLTRNARATGGLKFNISSQI